MRPADRRAGKGGGGIMLDEDLDDVVGSGDSEKLGTGSDGLVAIAFGVVEPSGSSIMSVGNSMRDCGGEGGITAASFNCFDSAGVAFFARPFKGCRGSSMERASSCILGAVSSWMRFCLVGVSAITPPEGRH